MAISKEQFDALSEGDIIRLNQRCDIYSFKDVTVMCLERGGKRVFCEETPWRVWPIGWIDCIVRKSEQIIRTANESDLISLFT